MERRTVLSALGAGVVPLAGCLGRASSGPHSTDTPPPTPRDGRRQVRLASVGSVPADVPLDPSVEVVRSAVTADRTARIRTTLTNTADAPVWNVTRIRTLGDFVTRPGPRDQRLLLLVPDGQYETVRPDCWRADLGERAVNWVYSDVVAPVRYDVDETKATAFDVYGHPENTGPCLAPGDYPVETRYGVSDDSDTDASEWDYRWGFTITVAEP